MDLVRVELVFEVAQQQPQRVRILSQNGNHNIHNSVAVILMGKAVEEEFDDDHDR